MMKARLILIEGIAGSGKSAVGEKLARILREHNISVRFYHEFDRMHPIKESDTEDSSKLIDNAISNWRAFVDQQTNTDMVTIFDGVLSQCFIADLILASAEEQVIVEGIRRLVKIIKVLSPCVIYLYQQDIRAAITRAYNRRSQNWRKKIDTFISNTTFGREKKLGGLSGYIAFNRYYSAFLDSTMNDIGIDLISIETSQERWSAYYREISDFLSIPPVENNSIKALNTQGS